MESDSEAMIVNFSAVLSIEIGSRLVLFAFMMFFFHFSTGNFIFVKFAHCCGSGISSRRLHFFFVLRKYGKAPCGFK